MVVLTLFFPKSPDFFQIIAHCNSYEEVNYLVFKVNRIHNKTANEMETTHTQMYASHFWWRVRNTTEDSI